jgi:hypothetical protein
MLNHVPPLEGLNVKEPQCGRSLRHRFRSQLPLPQQLELTLTDLLRAELVSWQKRPTDIAWTRLERILPETKSDRPR